MADNLKTLFPGSKTVVVQGEAVLIEPFKFSKITTVIRLISSVFDRLTLIPSEILEDASAMNNPAAMAYFMNILQDGGENVLELIALAAKRDREWVENIDTDEGLELMIAIFDVNRDFFEKRLKPLVQNLSAKLKALNPAEEEDKKN